MAPQVGETQPSEPHARAAQAPNPEDVWLSAAPAKRLGASTGKTPAEVLVPGAKRITLAARDQLLTPEQKEILSTDGLNSAFRSLALRVVHLPVLGWLFQQTFSRRSTTVILDTPYGELSVYVNTAFILSELAVCSLTEDKFGNVQRDVPAIIRTFTTVIKKLERFRDELPIHWTDVAQDRTCEDLDVLLNALKVGLGRLIDAFGAYSADLRLSRADMRLAREAAQRRPAQDENDGHPEMQQVN